MIPTPGQICARLEAECLYVKQEEQTTGPNGKEARATRLITERASRRIGQMAFELALARERKVCLVHAQPPHSQILKLYSRSL